MTDTVYDNVTVYRRPAPWEREVTPDGAVADVLHAATELVNSARAATFRPGTSARRWAKALREELCVMLAAADSDAEVFE